jgi:hypothetical protein
MCNKFEINVECQSRPSPQLELQRNCREPRIWRERVGIGGCSQSRERNRSAENLYRKDGRDWLRCRSDNGEKGRRLGWRSGKLAADVSPRGKVPGSAHILDPPAHDLGQLLLVDPRHLLLGNVVVLVLLQSAVLAVHAAVLAEGAGTVQSAGAFAVGVVGGVDLALSAELHVPGLGEHVRDALLAQVLGLAGGRPSCPDAAVAVAVTPGTSALLGAPSECRHSLLLA